MRVRVRVRTGAPRTRVGGTHGEALLVWVRARPVEGAANAELLRALAEAFGVRAAAVRLLSGASGRDKWVQIDGDEEVLTARRVELTAG